MLVLLLVIGLIGLGIGVFGMLVREPLYGEQKDTLFRRFKRSMYLNDSYYTINIIFGIWTGILIIIFAIAAPTYSEHVIIDNKIEMYQEENQKIETSIETVINQYQDYEQTTFEKCKSDPSIVFVMYPELKSNELVSKQIEIYMKNNEKIKSLKVQKLDYKVLGWWLYFKAMN